jgi:hypothetical protein
VSVNCFLGPHRCVGPLYKTQDEAPYLCPNHSVTIPYITDPHSVAYALAIVLYRSTILAEEFYYVFDQACRYTLYRSEELYIVFDRALRSTLIEAQYQAFRITAYCHPQRREAQRAGTGYRAFRNTPPPTVTWPAGWSANLEIQPFNPYSTRSQESSDDEEDFATVAFFTQQDLQDYWGQGGVGWPDGHEDFEPTITEAEYHRTHNNTVAADQYNEQEHQYHEYWHGREGAGLALRPETTLTTEEEAAFFS